MKETGQPRIWTTRTFDRLSRYYDRFMQIFFPIGEKGRIHIVEKLGTGSILDVACGTGTLLAMAAEKGLDCYGIDLSQGMLDQARMKVPGGEFKQASYYEIPYPDGSFDHVVETNAVGGVFIDARKVMTEMIRVCKKGGWVYLADWPVAPKDSLMERLVVKFASLSEDAPKDYLGIFKELGYEPEVDVLGKRYHVFGVMKK